MVTQTPASAPPMAPQKEGEACAGREQGQSAAPWASGVPGHACCAALVIRGPFLCPTRSPGEGAGGNSECEQPSIRAGRLASPEYRENWKRGRKKPCLNLKIKMLMRFLFQKHILLIKLREHYRLVGGPAAAGSCPALPQADLAEGPGARAWQGRGIEGSRPPRGDRTAAGFALSQG